MSVAPLNWCLVASAYHIVDDITYPLLGLLIMPMPTFGGMIQYSECPKIQHVLVFDSGRHVGRGLYEDSVRPGW
jgi:hypothetical protein